MSSIINNQEMLGYRLKFKGQIRKTDLKEEQIKISFFAVVCDYRGVVLISERNTADMPKLLVYN